MVAVPPLRHSFSYARKIRRSEPSPPRTVSNPLPPSSVSDPDPPLRRSFPAPPERVSLPEPPTRLSLPLVPVRVVSPLAIRILLVVYSQIARSRLRRISRLMCCSDWILGGR